jgi:hypothetical protein
MLQTSPSSLRASTDPALAPALRFHVPFEHGAWWSYLSTLIAGMAVVALRDGDRVALAGLTLALLTAFLAQDWAQSLLGALLGRRGQALSHWMAPQGWFLAGLSLGGALVLLQREAPAQRLGWALVLGALVLGGLVVLLGRVLQAARGRQSLAASALLLASPALALGWLAFGPGRLALAFWAWPLAYYPAATLAAQSFIRGFPRRARWAGPALAAGLGLAACLAGAWAPGSLLLAQAALLQFSIVRRWRRRPQGLPQGGEIRAFGRLQALFGVTLTLLWAWAFATL